MAFVVVHDKVTVLLAVTLVLDAVKVTVGAFTGTLTVTVTSAVSAPSLFDAVNLYVVVLVGDTDILLRLRTLPTP